MRVLIAFLLLCLLIPRIGDDSPIHAAVCLNATTGSMDHAHEMHSQMEHHDVQSSQVGDCQHCGDCGVHVGSTLSSNVCIHIERLASAPTIARDHVRAIARATALIRPPLA